MGSVERLSGNIIKYSPTAVVRITGQCGMAEQEANGQCGSGRAGGQNWVSAALGPSQDRAVDERLPTNRLTLPRRPKQAPHLR